MGCGITKTQTIEEQKEIAVDKEINNQLMLEQRQTHLKMLLLGAGGTGKTTLLKQMRIINLEDYDDMKRKKFIRLIRHNTITAMQHICRGCNTLRIGYSTSENKELADYIIGIDKNAAIDNMDDKLKDSMKKLYNEEPSITQCIERRFELPDIIDSAPYFLCKLQEILAESYLPVTQDILRSREPTIGINETVFRIKQADFHVFDVGGQRGERRKWIKCFDGVAAIIFVASLSEYCQVLTEDRSKNRMKESIDLFKSILGLPWFKKTHIILFLNKSDLFKEALLQNNLSTHFPRYSGSSESEAFDYVMNMYTKVNADKTRKIFVHKTNATDTKDIEFVWVAVQNIIFANCLSDLM